MTHLHIPFQDLADYYEAGWILYGPSDTPGFVTVAWKRTRAAVVPFACMADVMIRRDIERLQIREAALERLMSALTESVVSPTTAELLSANF